MGDYGTFLVRQRVGWSRQKSGTSAIAQKRGRPVQYSYLARPLELWDVQTAYAAQPCAVEAPSAGYPLNAQLLLALKERGIGLAPVTHAAGRPGR